MAEAHHRKLQTLIKQQAAEGLCATCGEKVRRLLTGPQTSPSSSKFNCRCRWSVLYSHTDMVPNWGWTSLLMVVVFAFLQNDTVAAFFKGEVKGFWQLAVSGVWGVFC